MNLDAAEALEEAIANWTNMLTGQGYKTCPLCLKFNYFRIPSPGMSDNDRREKSCHEYPVMLHTGVQFCAGTPYDAYEKINPEGESFDVKMEAKIIQEELDFLISLRK